MEPTTNARFYLVAILLGVVNIVIETIVVLLTGNFVGTIAAVIVMILEPIGAGYLASVWLRSLDISKKKPWVRFVIITLLFIVLMIGWWIFLQLSGIGPT